MKTMERDGALMARAIDWLGRLPLLGVEELSSLLQTREDSVSRALSELERIGCVEWVAPESPEVMGRRLFVVANGAIDAGLARGYALDRKEILLRMARVETTVVLNRFLVEAVEAASHDIEIDLADARFLPSVASREVRRWPPDIEAYGCLRWGPWLAPFFVALDRAGAPDLHRRLRVSGWYAFGESETPWTRDGLPTILVVCPSEREIEQWAKAVIASADRRGCAPLSVVLATASAAWRDPLGAIWRRVDGIRHALLCERLRWVLHLPSGAEPPGIGARLSFQQVEQKQPPLRDWARAVVEDDRRRRSLGETERMGALALVAGADHKTLLEWIGHHPLLSVAELSVLVDLPAPLVQRLLGRLSEWGLVDAVVRAASEDDVPLPRHFLTGGGLRLLAARDGVPWQRYFRHGVLAAPAQGKRQRDRLKGFLTQFEHTVGVNSFFVRLGASTPASGRLLRWLNAAESTEWCEYGGKRHRLRPDGSGLVAAGGQIGRFFLEWDRGTMRGPQMMEKFHYYAAYCTSRRSKGDVPLAVLIVTNAPHRENVIWQDLEAAFDEVKAKPSRFFTSIDTLISGVGAFGPVWRPFDSVRRVRWRDSEGATLKEIALEPFGGGDTTRNGDAWSAFSRVEHDR
jgi:hypothetical protein